MERCSLNGFFWGGGVNFESMSYVPHVDYLRTRHKKVILLPTGLGMVRGMDQKWKDVP